MKPFAFFFNANYPSLEPSYGLPCTAEIIRALEVSSPEISTQILRGDLLPHRMSYEVSKVEAGQKNNSRHISQTQTANSDLYKLIVCDLADSLSEEWCTVDAVRFPLEIFKNRIWTVVLPSINACLAKEIDACVAGFPPYLGGCGIDLGNPLHVELFKLSGGAFFKNGILFYGQSYEFDEKECLSQAKMYGGLNEPVILSQEAYVKGCPVNLEPLELSIRGKVSASRLEGKKELSHKQKLAHVLLDFLQKNPEINDFTYSVELDDKQDEFICEESKVKDYLLNLDHPDGKSKAKFFLETLEIERSDWRFLADQITEAMASAVLYRVKNSEHGVSHGAIILISGRNGKATAIQTGWLVKNGESSRLITAYPYSDALEEEPLVPAHNVSPIKLDGDPRWADIYKRAHMAGGEAANRCVPTPMTLEGYSPVFEGQCGYAWVTVYDVRKGMARWLKKNSIGHPNYQVGWDVPANPEPNKDSLWGVQSIEPKKAYADAFSRVLKSNGVECSSHNQLD